MKFVQTSAKEISIEFNSAELEEISRVLTAIGIPMNVFGGLSKESPNCKVRLEKGLQALSEINTLGMISSSLGTSISKLESAPLFVRKQVQERVADALRRLPSGLFISKD